jgi:hypothetical protein
MPLSPDRPGIRPWKAKEPVDHKRLNEMQAAALTDITVGPGLRMVRKGNSVAVGLAEQRRPAAGNFDVRISGALAGTGYYVGHVVSAPTIPHNPLSPGPARNGEAGTEEIVIYNKGPLETGHVLTDTTDGPVTQTDFEARWWGMTNEDPPRRVARIFGLNPYECSTSEEPEPEAMVADDNVEGTNIDDGII